MSGFKDMVARDNHGVFLNNSEFAEMRTIKYDGATYSDIPIVLSGMKEKDRRQLMSDHTSTNYTNVGTKVQSDGYIKALGMSSNMPWAFFPSEVGGSETTYIPDYAGCNSGWRVLFVGGGWDGGGHAGLFCFNADNSSSGSYSSVGARLLFHP